MQVPSIPPPRIAMRASFTLSSLHRIERHDLPQVEAFLPHSRGDRLGEVPGMQYHVSA